MTSRRTPPRLLLLVNDAGFFVSHRLPLALAARAAGYDVHVATAGGEAAALISSQGLPHHSLQLSRGGVDPIGEAAAFIGIWRLLRQLRPDLLHLVTVKPVVYGGIAARLAGVPAVVAAISGLGHVFVADDGRTRLLRRAVTLAYRVALRHRRLRVIFQNVTDRERLARVAGLQPEQIVMLRGSGVDLNVFRPVPEPGGVPVVTFASRLLRPKGVCEFVAAAEALRAGGLRARFQLVGAPDPANASSVTAAEVAQWRAAGAVEVLGHRSDMAAVFAASNLVVLPSYYGEGLPKVLAEVSACGRAVVTTDMPGCRDAIEAGTTGLLVPPRDVPALADAIRTLLADSPRRQAMGGAARALAEREYAIERIVARHLAVYAELLGPLAPRGVAP